MTITNKNNSESSSLFITKIVLIIFVITTMAILLISVVFAFGSGEDFKNYEKCIQNGWIERGCL
jgi:hypothetical protein